MTHRHLLIAVFSVFSLACFSQNNLSDNERKYLVYTVQPGQKPVTAKAVGDGLAEDQKEEVDSMNIWFPFYSLCDWQPGMRFMVMPDKKDLVIKTFADAATGHMVSSQSLMHKVMVYEGHDDANGGLHEHVNFVCEETGARYYYEVPTATFDDYCYTKFGIPTLAYLGEVDSARVRFMGKKLITVADRYFIDDPKTSDGYVEIHDVPRDTEVEVVAVGVGTRSFPVKIIVREEGENGRQFFQNVTFSKTNCGLRDDELEISNMIFHNFDASFKIADDNLSVHPLYQKYIGKEVYTLQNTTFTDDKKMTVRLPRLTVLTVKKIRSQSGSEYAKVTLYDDETSSLDDIQSAISSLTEAVTTQQNTQRNLPVEGGNYAITLSGTELYLNLSQGADSIITVTSEQALVRFVADATEGRYFITDTSGNGLFYPAASKSNWILGTTNGNGHAWTVVTNSDGTITFMSTVNQTMINANRGLGASGNTDGSGVDGRKQLGSTSGGTDGRYMYWIVDAAGTTGDVDINGEVGMSDAEAIVNVLLGQDTSNYDLAAADVNGDGKITLADVTALINQVLGR